MIFRYKFFLSSGTAWDPNFILNNPAGTPYEQNKKITYEVLGIKKG